MNINIDEKDLFQFILTEMRCGITKDNLIFLGDAVQHAKKYIPLMRVLGVEAALQLKLEVEKEIRFKDFSDANKWRLLDFVIWLNDFIIKSH